MADSNCIFCTIARKEIPCYTVYEDSHTLAFLDIHPHCKGHTVLIPKMHGETMFDLDESTIKALALSVVKVMKRIQEVLHPDGFNVGWNHLPAGGQAVPHLHLHIFPRYNDDNGGSMHSIIKNPGTVAVEEVAKLFGKKDNPNYEN